MNWYTILSKQSKVYRYKIEKKIHQNSTFIVEFGSAAVKRFVKDNNIRLDTSVSKLEHKTGGNKLGIIDRLVQALRELIERYYDILGYRKEVLQGVIDSIIATYNNNNHRSLQN